MPSFFDAGRRKSSAYFDDPAPARIFCFSTPLQHEHVASAIISRIAYFQHTKRPTMIRAPVSRASPLAGHREALQERRQANLTIPASAAERASPAARQIRYKMAISPRGSMLIIS